MSLDSFWMKLYGIGFVCGIRSEHIQKRLLSDFLVTFVDACKLAQAAEIADRQAKTFTVGSGSLAGTGQLHQVTKEIQGGAKTVAGVMLRTDAQR